MDKELRAELRSALERFQENMQGRRSEPQPAIAIVPLIKAIQSIDDRLTRLEQSERDRG
jgi:hypothetical protein